MVSLELEMEMMKDMFDRLSRSCSSLCMNKNFNQREEVSDASLSMPERVCLDRCMAKYFRIHERMGQKLTEIEASQRTGKRR